MFNIKVFYGFRVADCGFDELTPVLFFRLFITYSLKIGTFTICRQFVKLVTRNSQHETQNQL